MSFIVQKFTWNDGAEESTAYKVKSLFTKQGAHIYQGKKICELVDKTEKRCLPIKAKFGGVISKIPFKVGDEVLLGDVLIEIKACTHPTVLGNLCCDCGIVLEPIQDQSKENESLGLVSMLHSVPDLKVSKEEATRVGNEDIKHLLDKRKLVLLVDLDQTLIHTTNDNIPPKLRDVFHFQLIQNGPWYHTRLRPFTSQFLHNISKLYELHICTFGVREYAHCIAHFLDPERKLFGDRILSRNECLDSMSKKANLSSLFPCGDNLVCIIDDRSDVWNFAPNVVQVMPYHFFQHTGDINAPPGLQKKENDTTSKGFDFSSLEGLASTKKMKQNSCDKERDELSSADEELAKEDSDHSGKSDGKASELEEGEASSSLERTDENPVKGPVEITDPSKSSCSNKGEPSCLPHPLSKELEVEEKEELGAPKLKPIPSSHPSPPPDSSSEDEASFLLDEKMASSVNDSDTLDVEDSDDYLLYLEDILTKLHSRFYEIYTLSLKDISPWQDEDSTASLPDLKEIVPSIRKKVLAGTHLVFSGIVPQSVNLRESKAYHIAISLGATVSDKLTSKAKKEMTPNGVQDAVSFPTTHVVAANLHTEKVHQAKRLKYIKIVTPNWLWCCAERWERADERLFKLNNESEKTLLRNPPMHCFVNLAEAAPASISMPVTVPVAPPKEQPLFNSVNPFAFLSNDETKSMEEEVDDLLSSEEDNKPKKQKTVIESSESADDDDSSSRSSPKESSDDEPERKRKRLCLGDDDDEDDDDEEEELPSIRFRQGGALPSDASEIDSADDDMNAYGDILERELMRTED